MSLPILTLPDPVLALPPHVARYSTVRRRGRWLSLSAEHESVPAARQWVQRICQAWRVTPDTADDATLCASELVTNALVHGVTSSCVTLAILRSGGQLTVSLRQTGIPAGNISVRKATENEDHGRGLLLVSKLATEWGHSQVTGGTVVWCTLIWSRPWHIHVRGRAPELVELPGTAEDAGRAYRRTCAAGVASDARAEVLAARVRVWEDRQGRKATSRPAWDSIREIGRYTWGQ